MEPEAMSARDDARLALAEQSEFVLSRQEWRDLVARLLREMENPSPVPQIVNPVVRPER